MARSIEKNIPEEQSHVFAENVNRDIGIILRPDKTQETVEMREIRDRRVKTLKSFLSLLGVRSAMDVAQQIVEGIYDVGEITDALRSEDLAGFRKYLVFLEGPDEYNRPTEYEKYKDVREQKEDFEDEEPKISDTRGGYQIRIDQTEILLKVLRERQLIEDSSEALDFWRGVLEELEEIEWLLNAFLIKKQ